MKSIRVIIKPVYLIWLILMIVLILFVSCKSGETSAPAPSLTTSAVAQTASPSATNLPPASTQATTKPATIPAGPTGTLKIAMPSFEDETFLPWNGTSGRKFYLDTIYEYLFYQNPETREPIPGLATEYKMSPDGKIWTFILRKGVQFHENYGEMTSEDVKYTFERIMAPESKSAQASTFRASVERIETPDKYTVVFYLKIPDFGFWGKTAINIGNSIVCKNYVSSVGDDKANAHPIGTGPYRLVEHKKQVSITLETIAGVENHWRVVPQFKTIIFRNAPEESTRVAMLKTGEVDLASISYDSVETVKASGLNVISVKHTWAPVIRMGGLVKTDPKRFNANAPWAKKEVRQALNYAVDKEAIVRNIFKGQANASYNPFSYENLSAPPYPYDPVKAKLLIGAAGYPDGFQVNLYTCSRNPGAQLPDIGLAVATYWEAVGIKVKIIPTDYPTIRAAWTGGKANDMFWTHVSQMSPLQYDAGGLMSGNQSSNMFALFTTPELDPRVLAANAEPDPEKRATLISDIWDTLIEEATDIWICDANEPYGASKQIGRWPTWPFYPTNFDQLTRP